MDKQSFGDSPWRLAGLVLLLTLGMDILLRWVRGRMARELGPDDVAVGSRRAWLAAIVPPLSLGVWFYGVFAAARVVAADRLPPEWRRAEGWLQSGAGICAALAFLWLLSRVAKVIEAGLAARAEETESRWDNVLLPLTGAALRLILPVVALFFLVRLWALDGANEAMVRKLAAVALILGLTWLAFRAAALVERALIEKSGENALSTLDGRAVITRVRLLRRIITFLVGLFALAATLMLFDEVRDVGRSLLASAGVAGLIIGFAAQRSIGGIFAGLQIAVTQPIRIGDVVRVAGETGVVDEITLTYVALQIWDGRRLIVPINHLIENPVVNHTRNDAPQVGVVVMRVDFLLPIPEFRAFMKECVAKMPQWDKKVFGVDVVDSLNNCMEIRIVASAADPGASFGLQCGLREQAIGFIRERYPHCLPKIRQEQRRAEAEGASEGDAGARRGKVKEEPLRNESVAPLPEQVEPWR